MSVPTTQDVLFRAIVEQLKAVLSLDDAHCYYTMASVKYAQVPQGGDFWIEVSDGNSILPEGMQISGGRNQCVESMRVATVGYARTLLDPGSHGISRATDPQRGLFLIKQRMLYALCDWEPFDPEGNLLTNEPMHAMSGVPANWDAEENRGDVTLLWPVEFQWSFAAMQ
jgi:hypothetical protein